MIVQIAVTLFILTIIFLIFSYSQIEANIGIWIVLMIFFAFVLSLSTTVSNTDTQRIHPTFTVAQYSIYNANPPITNT